MLHKYFNRFNTNKDILNQSQLCSSFFAECTINKIKQKLGHFSFVCLKIYAVIRAVLVGIFPGLNTKSTVEGCRTGSFAGSVNLTGHPFVCSVIDIRATVKK